MKSCSLFVLPVAAPVEKLSVTERQIPFSARDRQAS
jgi:hypothetical protein